MTDEPGTDVEVAQPAPERALTPMELQWKFAQRVCHTEFVPAAFKNRPDAVLAAICYGEELGIGPMQSLQSINVIEGKPSLAPEAMRSRVFAAGHTINTLTYTDEQVTLEGVRDNGAKATVSWSIYDAERAGLCSIQNGKPRARSQRGKPLPWETYTRAMLLARATSELCRLLFPDVIAGASYVPEELGSDNPPPDDSADVIDGVEISGAEASADSSAPAEVGDGRESRDELDPPVTGAVVVDDHKQFHRATETQDVTDAEVVESEPEAQPAARPALAPVLEARRNVTPPPCDDDLNAELIGKMRAPALAKAALRNGISTANKTPDDLRAALLELVSDG